MTKVSSMNQTHNCMLNEMIYVYFCGSADLIGELVRKHRTRSIDFRR